MATIHARGAGFPIDTQVTDEALFEALDLDLEGLGEVRAACARGDTAQAKRELAQYLRRRTIRTWRVDPHTFRTNVPHGEASLRGVRAMLNREPPFTDEHWTADGEFRWDYKPNVGNKVRQYFLEAVGRAYWASGRDEEIAKLWHRLLRSWLRQVPRPEDRNAGIYWNTLVTGIRMRSSWPTPFHYFLCSPNFTDEDIVLYLKSTIQQARHLRKHHRETGNWLTFSMVGLYTAGVVFPELKEASPWRAYAAETALADLQRGYLPDGMGVELSPGYHNLFYNYTRICDLAGSVGRSDEAGIRALDERCERLFEPYVHLCAPDRTMPKYQDGGLVDVQERLQAAVQRYPGRGDFQWIATDGKQGKSPEFTSSMLPYAGYFAMRSGWGRAAHHLAFDAGPIGWKHCHADKLNMLLWSHGRLLIFDPGVGTYDDEPLANWARDTFAHNTVLVDNRPQRRRWSTPNPSQMPYQPVKDIRWQTTPTHDSAYGVYAGAYGIRGPSDPYPYWDDSDYREGWVRPAVHHRRIHFLKPDIFVVADTLISQDGQPHAYDLRWQLLTTTCSVAEQSKVAVTRDEGQPNLAVVPLLTDGLRAKATSAQMEPEIMGWKYYTEPEPATTLQHLKSGPGTVQFVTLLLPLAAGQACPVRAVRASANGSITVSFTDGRTLTVLADPDPSEDLHVASAR